MSGTRKTARMAARVMALSALLVSAAAFAERGSHGGYFGVGATSTKLKDPSDALIGTEIDDKDGGLKLFAGYQFNRNVAVEAGYTDFGDFSASGAVAVPPFGTVDGDKWEVTGVNVSAILSAPIGTRFSVFARAGLMHWNVDDVFVLNGSSVASSESGTSPDVGLGVQYAFGRHVTGRLEWEQISNVGEVETTGRSDLTTVSANLLFRF